SCAMKVAKAVGETLRDEIEMARLRDPDKIDYRRVMGAKNRHAVLSRYRTLDWSNRVLVRAGWWLLNCGEACDLFESEQCEVGRNVPTLPKIADGHWEQIKRIREELSLARPTTFRILRLPQIGLPGARNMGLTGCRRPLFGTSIRTRWRQSRKRLKAASLIDMPMASATFSAFRGR